MALTDVINVVVSKQGPGVTAAGFGVPLLGSASAAWAERTRVYEDLNGVGSDFATTTPEYLWAETAFGQSPHVEQIMIGRLALKPTMVQTITILSAVDNTVYSCNVFVNGVLQTASFNSGAGSSVTSIATGLKNAINALAAPAPNFAALSSVGVITCTGSAPGNWFALEPLHSSVPTKVPDLMELKNTTADPGIATDLGNILDESDAWYGLNLLFKGNAIVLAAAGFIEANARLFPVACSETQAATIADATPATDVVHNLKAASRARSAAFYHPRDYEFLDAAAVGRWFPISPGSDNWRMKVLSGPTPEKYTATQKANLKAKHAGYFYTFGGLNVMGGEGTVADNEYIDIIRGIDWWTARLSERVSNLEIQQEKISFDDDGITQLENEIRAQNQDGINAKLIAKSPRPTVTAILAEDTSSADRTARTYNGLATQWRVAGAINHLTVNATVLQ